MTSVRTMRRELKDLRELVERGGGHAGTITVEVDRAMSDEQLRAFVVEELGPDCADADIVVLSRSPRVFFGEAIYPRIVFKDPEPLSDILKSIDGSSPWIEERGEDETETGEAGTSDAGGEVATSAMAGAAGC